MGTDVITPCPFKSRTNAKARRIKIPLSPVVSVYRARTTETAKQTALFELFANKADVISRKRTGNSISATVEAGPNNPAWLPREFAR